jgi:hypothetical protein
MKRHHAEAPLRYNQVGERQMRLRRAEAATRCGQGSDRRGKFLALKRLGVVAWEPIGRGEAVGLKQRCLVAGIARELNRLREQVAYGERWRQQAAPGDPLRRYRAEPAPLRESAAPWQANRPPPAAA